MAQLLTPFLGDRLVGAALQGAEDQGGVPAAHRGHGPRLPAGHEVGLQRSGGPAARGGPGAGGGGVAGELREEADTRAPGHEGHQLPPPARARCRRIAPTENDPWRGRVVRGEVHDENAFALGGMAPHAGLFGTAPDLARFAQMLLNGGVYDHRRIVSRATRGAVHAPRRAFPAPRGRWAGTPRPTRPGRAARPPGRPAIRRREAGSRRRSFGHTGLHGHLALDGSGATAVRHPADEPRAPDAREQRRYCQVAGVAWRTRS